MAIAKLFAFDANAKNWSNFFGECEEFESKLHSIVPVLQSLSTASRY